MAHTSGGAETLTDRYAAWRASTLGRITDSLERDAILRCVAARSGQHVLDAGCGDGALAGALDAAGVRVTGIDADPAMLAAARSRGGGFSLVRGDVRALPFPDNHFDAAVAVTVLCLVDDPGRVVGEMARVVRPGGRIVLGELGRWSLWALERRLRGWVTGSFWSSATFWTAGGLRRLMAGVGLSPGPARGAVYYPRCALGARMVRIVDPWLGRLTPVGAAFLVVAGSKPGPDLAAGKSP